MTATAAAPAVPVSRPSAAASASAAARWPGRVAATASVLVPALVTVGPWLGGGWVVLLDFVPGPLGTGSTFDAGRLPSGPAFTVPVALLGRLAGERVTAVVVLVVLVALGLAGRSLARALGCGATASATAAVAAAWNPFVFDRLHAGQLATLAATAATMVVAARAGSGRRSTWWVVLAGACSVQFLAYAALAALLLSRAPLRRRAGEVAVAFLATAAWLLPLLPGAPPTGGVAAASVFGTTADPQLGRAIGVAVGGGFWRPPADAVGADLGWLWVAVVVGLLGVAVAGLRSAARRGRAFGAVGLAGWLLAHGTAGPAGEVYRWGMVHLPAAGAFREAHKAAALVVVASVAGIALAVDRRGWTRRWASPAVLVLVVLAAPGQGWGLGGRVVAVDEPAAWVEARTTLAAAGAAPGAVVVLPWSSYLRPILGGGRLVQDPTPGFVVTEATRRTTSGIPGTPEHEVDPTAAAVARAVADPAGPQGLPARLAALGVEWLLVIDDAAGVDAGLRWDGVDGVEVVVRGDGISLYRTASVPVGPSPPT